MVKVRLKNGEIFNAHLKSRDKKIMSFEMGDSVRVIDSKEVFQIISNKELIYSDPVFKDTYIFMPSGIQLKQGEGYFRNTMLGVNGFSLGLTDNVSISAYAEFFSGDFNMVFFPKVGGEIADKVHLSFTIPLFKSKNAISSFGIGTLTFGSSKSNFSIGVGTPLSPETGNLDFGFALSGVLPMSEHVSLVSENYFIPDSEDTYGFGVQSLRFTGRRNTFDLGLFVVPSESAFPYASYIIGF